MSHLRTNHQPQKDAWDSHRNIRAIGLDDIKVRESTWGLKYHWNSFMKMKENFIDVDSSLGKKVYLNSSDFGGTLYLLKKYLYFTGNVMIVKRKYL